MTNTLAHPDVIGDGLSLAVRVGAGIDKDVASAGFWTPGSILQERQRLAGRAVRLAGPRSCRGIAARPNAKRIRRLQRKITIGTS